MGPPGSEGGRTEKDQPTRAGTSLFGRPYADHEEPAARSARPAGHTRRLAKAHDRFADAYNHRRPHHIGIGRTHARTHVLMLVDDLHIRVVNAVTGELLRELILNPTCDYQPQQTPTRRNPRTRRFEGFRCPETSHRTLGQAHRKSTAPLPAVSRGRLVVEALTKLVKRDAEQ